MRSTTPVAVAAVLVAALGVGALVGRHDTPVAGAPRATSPAPTPGPSRTPLLAALPGEAPAPSAAGLSAALAGPLAAPALGRSVAASVVDATTGATLLDLRGSASVVPASTLKLATAAAVLTGLPPDDRLTTRALAGPGPGDVVLVGGGDVTLAGPAAGPSSPPAARLADLAAQVVAARGRRAGRPGAGRRHGVQRAGDRSGLAAVVRHGRRRRPRRRPVRRRRPRHAGQGHPGQRPRAGGRARPSPGCSARPPRRCCAAPRRRRGRAGRGGEPDRAAAGRADAHLQRQRPGRDAEPGSWRCQGPATDVRRRCGRGAGRPERAGRRTARSRRSTAAGSPATTGCSPPG